MFTNMHRPLPQVSSSSSISSMGSTYTMNCPTTTTTTTQSSPARSPTPAPTPSPPRSPPGPTIHIKSDADLYCISKMERLLMQDEKSKLQPYIYTTDVTTHLRCVICTQPYVQPTMHTQCGQTMCKGCVETWKSNGKPDATSCPVCRGELSTSTLIAAPRCIDSMLDELAVQCTQCKITMQRGDFAAHRQHDCHQSNALAKCTQGCGLKLPAHHMDIHTKIDCPNAYIRCPSADPDNDDPSPCTFKGTQRQLTQHTKTCKYVQQQLVEEIADQESNAQLEALHKYRNLYSQANLYNLKLRAKLNSTMMDTLIERTVFGVYGSCKSGLGTPEQAAELVDCALTIVDLLGEFCNYVLEQPVHQMSTDAMKRYLRPAVKELNANLQLLQQRYGNVRPSSRSRPAVSVPTRTERSASVSTPHQPRRHLTMSSHVQQPTYQSPGPFAVASTTPTRSMHTSSSNPALSTMTDSSPRPRTPGMWKRFRRAITVQTV